MKKIFILAGILLLPFFVSAYEFGPEYENMARDIEETVTSTAARATKDTAEDARKDKIKRVKDILFDAFKSLNLMNGINTISAAKYYDTDDVSQKLSEEKLYTFLENDAEALDEVADYTTKHNILWNPYNDFETLLTLGVSPIEAAIRAEEPDYVESALNEGTITYIHYTTERYKDAFGGGIRAKTEKVSIPVTTTAEEINTVKEKLRKKSFWEHIPYIFDKIDNILESFINRTQIAEN